MVFGIWAKVHDMKGRVTQQVEAYDGRTTLPLSATSVTTSTNRATNYSYDGLCHIYQLTAVMPTGTNSQTTQYNYGVTAGTGASTISSNDLLASIQYPDKTAGTLGTNASDKQSYTYNAAGQPLSFTDQNATVHAYTYDLLGRKTADAVTIASGNPQGVDTTVLARTFTFDTGDRPYQFTTYNAASGGSVVNQVEDLYNGLGNRHVKGMRSGAELGCT